MNHKVTIRQFSCTIDVRAGQSILDAALKAGLDYPYACRSGTCSACKTLVLNGKVEQRACDPSALTGAEREAGMILACKAYPVSDCEISLVDDDLDMPAVRKVDCTVTAVRQMTHDVALIEAVPNDGRPIEFLAGQFAVLSVPGLPPREYSFANPPGSGELEFHIRARPEGLVSAHFCGKAKPGDRFTLRGPFGHAYLRKDHGGPIALVAGGTGLAPAKSILTEALKLPSPRPVDLFFSVRFRRDLYLDDHFRELAENHRKFRFHPVITDEPDSPCPRDIFALMQQHIADFKAAKIYTCGPPALVRACQDFVHAQGTLPGNCHADPFTSQSTQQFLNSA